VLQFETEVLIGAALVQCKRKSPKLIIYFNLGKVQFALRGEGGDDEGGLGRASMQVNGVEYCPNKPGHNIIVLDPTGEIVHVKNFNTNAGEGPDMARFLEELPDDHVVLVATNNVTGKEQGVCYQNVIVFHLV
jgi:hypothetical protein